MYNIGANTYVCYIAFSWMFLIGLDLVLASRYYSHRVNSFAINIDKTVAQ